MERKLRARASSLILGTKKEDLPQSQFACVESQFAYPGDTKKEKSAGEPVRLCGEAVRLSWGHRRRTCRRASSLARRASSLILGAKKEELLESRFAYPGAKEGGPAGEPVHLRGEPVRFKEGGPAGEPVRFSWGQRRRTCRRASSLVWRASSLILVTKKEDLPKSQFACMESQLAYHGDKEGGPAGGLPKTAEGPPHRANLLLVVWLDDYLPNHTITL